MFNLDNIFNGKTIAPIKVAATTALEELTKQLGKKPE
jgi:hypothetical protein